jgi:cytidylate kinase
MLTESGRDTSGAGRRLVIAIDGPAASGKSTTAKLVAERLGYMHVDTGAMYRAITLKVLRSGLAPDDRAGITRLLETTRVQLRNERGALRVILDGDDVSEEIRSPEVTRAVSSVSSLAEVRKMMVREQRALGEKGGIVLEGRDIGTVVFPGAECKFFLIAGIGARAERRLKELRAKGVAADLEELQREIADRDRRDSTRLVSPLRKAADAVEIDTSDMTIEEQVDEVVQRVRERLEQLRGS